MNKEQTEKVHSLMVSPAMQRVLQMVAIMKDAPADDAEIKHTCFIDIIEKIDEGEIKFTGAESDVMIYVLMARTFMELMPGFTPEEIIRSIN